MSDPNIDDHSFVFATCQNGFEKICKQEILDANESFRFAFSRPGLLTFKTPRLKQIPDLRSTFTRTSGFSLGTVSAQTPTELVDGLGTLIVNLAFEAIHVWSRRLQNVAANEVAVQKYYANEGIEPYVECLSASFVNKSINTIPNSGSTVLDLILVDDGRWLVGYHAADQIAQRWPGGVPKITLPEKMISRAYLKTYEGILWSRMPLRPGDVCIEIGAAPGGSAQALLELGCVVLAVDPADMDAELMKDERIIHHRKRGREVKKSELVEARWLLADLSLVPNKTLETVEDIVTNENVHFKGMLLTLKLSESFKVSEIKPILERVQSWGYRFVKSRHLAFNRREFCVMALKQKAIRRT